MVALTILHCLHLSKDKPRYLVSVTDRGVCKHCDTSRVKAVCITCRTPLCMPTIEQGNTSCFHLFHSQLRVVESIFHMYISRFIEQCVLQLCFYVFNEKLCQAAHPLIASLWFARTYHFKIRYLLGTLSTEITISCMF